MFNQKIYIMLDFQIVIKEFYEIIIQLIERYQGIQQYYNGNEVGDDFVGVGLIEVDQFIYWREYGDFGCFIGKIIDQCR